MIRWAASRPAVMWAFAAGLLIAGGVAFTKLPLATKTTVELHGDVGASLARSGFGAPHPAHTLNRRLDR